MSAKEAASSSASQTNAACCLFHLEPSFEGTLEDWCKSKVRVRDTIDKVIQTTEMNKPCEKAICKAQHNL